ncbi:MAG: hypothetical protein CL807_03185 [Citromicrobium sp.]|nr:hypothetical protein [Citromicrobium sp.]MAO95955.1 hypothetical protein [Citromicrobium sp.]MAS85088.1 hypothetical protein [Erythrobacteraceae bacterium]MBD75899.1 hypothetical protein [Citromicrobium sp.]MBT46226.1 hypothetical protein [Citromicrobium sp.]|tara:strand:+ start:307 stop:525 length:219 start_codon:yes stop_codon:yes gene_type:complete
MKARNILAGAAALTLAAAPAIAEVNLDRAAAPVAGESEATGAGIVLGILALAAIIAGIVIAAQGGDDVPTSA